MLEPRARIALAIFGFADRRLTHLAIWTWRGRRDLNPRPPVRQTGALTTELHPHKEEYLVFEVQIKEFSEFDWLACYPPLFM